MSLRSTLGLGRESLLEEGTPDEVAEKKRRAYAAAVRPARLEVARRNPKWTEIENDLVPRGRGLLVSAETDAIYKPVRGVVFQPYSVNVIADQSCRSMSTTTVTCSSSRSSPEPGPHVERRERRRATRAPA